MAPGRKGQAIWQRGTDTNKFIWDPSPQWEQPKTIQPHYGKKVSHHHLCLADAQRRWENGSTFVVETSRVLGELSLELVSMEKPEPGWVEGSILGGWLGKHLTDRSRACGTELLEFYCRIWSGHWWFVYSVSQRRTIVMIRTVTILKSLMSNPLKTFV